MRFRIPSSRLAGGLVLFGALVLISRIVFVIANEPSCDLSNGPSTFESTHSADNEISDEYSDEISIEFFYQAGCGMCIFAEAVVDEFSTLHPSVNITKIEVNWGVNHSLYYDRLEALALEKVGTPSVVFIKGDYALLLEYSAINITSLEENYQFMVNYSGTGQLPGTTTQVLNPWLAFLSGLLTGISPCLILIMAVIAPIMSMEDISQKKLIRIFVGLTLGILTMYILLGVMIIFTLDVLAQFFSLPSIKWIFGGLMLSLGLWYLLDAFAENSALFSTPPSIKKFVNNMIHKGGMIYGFGLGFIFSILKIPCVGGVMIALFLGMGENPLYFSVNLLLFYVGLLLPLVILMILLLRGIDSEKIKTIRLKYRPLLRIITGLAIIGLTLYALLSV